MAPGNEQNDSGMESRNSSKEDTPEKRKAIEDDDDIPDEELEETLSERLWGLAEMFPENVRKTTHSLATGTWEGAKIFYSLSRTVTWVFFSSSVILFAPVLFEIERANVEESQRREQKQVLLGPNAAISGGGTGLVR